MITRKQVFEQLKKADHVAIMRDFGFKGWSVLIKGDIVAKLTRKRSIDMKMVLN